jgi:alpha-ketoglutarate-dependent taurine dioxygenase
LSLVLKPLDNFGAEVSRQKLDTGAIEAVTAAIDNHGVLVFRGPEPLTDTQQIAFTGFFGPL